MHIIEEVINLVSGIQFTNFKQFTNFSSFTRIISSHFIIIKELTINFINIIKRVAAIIGLDSISSFKEIIKTLIIEIQAIKFITIVVIKFRVIRLT